MKILLISLVKGFIRAEKPGKPKGTVFFRFPSLALANLAALTPEDDEIIVADEQISPVNYDINADLVAITVNTSVANRAYEIARQFRKRGKKVVLGGLHPSLMPDEALKFADAIIIGDAEGQWQQLLKDFKNKKLKRKYVNKQTATLKLPTPEWEIFKNMGYINYNFVEATRGCIHRCSFCSTSPFYYFRHRTRPIEDVIRDVKKVQTFPKKFIFFVDDNIIGNKEYAKKLFRALIPFHICWVGQATVDIGEDPELVELAAKSGCIAIFLGFESLSEKNLNAVGKKHNHMDSYKRTVKLLHKNGIGIEAGFVFGLDYDDKGIFKKTLDFLLETDMDAFISLYLTPIPGTKLYDDFKKQNRLLTKDYSKYDFRHAVVKPKGMTTKELYDGISWLTKEFYTRRRVFRRVRYKTADFLTHPHLRILIGVIAQVAFSLASRKRLKDYSVDGTFPASFRNI